MINSISELENITWLPTGKLIKDMTRQELLVVLLSEFNEIEELKSDFHIVGHKILTSLQFGRGT